MKKLFMFTAVVLVALAVTIGLTGAMAADVSAEETVLKPGSDRVYFISDDYSMGDGSGSDVNNPLRPIMHENYDPAADYPKNHLLTPFFQATERLKETGGTIVICGPTFFGADQSYGSGATTRDVFTASFGDNVIKFTSVYNGVDYRKTNGAKITVETPAMIGVLGSSIWENLDIETNGTERAISFGGYKTLIGGGMNCYTSDSAFEGVASNYISLSAGHRYAGSDGQITSLTVQSGTYGDIVGGIWGAVRTMEMTNAVTNLTLEGTTCVLGQINGSVRQNSLFSGHTNITINGGVYLCDINGVGPTGFLNSDGTVNIVINGGNFELAWSINESSKGATNNLPKESVVDMSAWHDHLYNMAAAIVVCTDVDVVYVPYGVTEDLIISVWEFYEELPNARGLYVAHPQKTTYYVGEELDTSGLYLDIDFADNTVASIYNGFVVTGFDSSTPGTKTLTIGYNDYYTTYPITVISPTITLSQSSLKMEIGEAVVLTAVTDPMNYDVTWSSSDPSVASVFGGKVTAYSSGSATITATLSYKGNVYKAYCEVTVEAPAALESVSIQTPPSKTRYFIGEELETAGLVLKLNYSNGTSKTTTGGFTVSGFDSEEVGEKTVTVNYEGKTAEFTVSVAEKEPRLIIGNARGGAGDTVDVIVSLKEVAEVKVVGISDISYDKTKLTLVEAKWLKTGAILTNWNDNFDGAMAYVKNTDLNGDLAKLTFKIADNAEEGDLAISCNFVAKGNSTGVEAAVDVAVVDGKITVSEVLPGDVDNDGDVDSDDAIYLLYSVLFGEEGYPLSQEGDFDGDSDTDSDDAIYLLYHVLFGEEGYPLR